MAEVVHRLPRADEGLTPCCRRTMFELPRTDRVTEDEALVTCFALSFREGEVDQAIRAGIDRHYAMMRGNRG